MIDQRRFFSRRLKFGAEKRPRTGAGRHFPLKARGLRTPAAAPGHAPAAQTRTEKTAGPREAEDARFFKQAKKQKQGEEGAEAHRAAGGRRRESRGTRFSKDESTSRARARARDGGRTRPSQATGTRRRQARTSRRPAGTQAPPNFQRRQKNRQIPEDKAHAKPNGSSTAARAAPAHHKAARQHAGAGQNHFRKANS